MITTKGKTTEQVIAEIFAKLVEQVSPVLSLAAVLMATRKATTVPWDGCCRPMMTA